MISQDSLWETGLAASSLAASLRKAVLHWLAVPVLIFLVPVVLYVAEDELNVCLVLVHKTLRVVHGI